jgi:transposase
MTAVQNHDSEILQNENVKLRHEVIQCNEKITHLEEQLNWFKRQIFGQRSERDISHINPNQLELSGFESLQKDDQEAKTVSAHNRRKPENKGKESIILPKDQGVLTKNI